MSFGFSVGDILGGAKLAYGLCQSLSATKGSAREYAKLIKELDAIHKVLLQVERLRESNQLRQETLNALLFTVNTANEAMEDFMIKCKAYEDSLRPGGSGGMWKDGWMKGKWYQNADPGDSCCFCFQKIIGKRVFGDNSRIPGSRLTLIKIETLRKTLATMLTSVNCLVTLACLDSRTRIEPNASESYVSESRRNLLSRLLGNPDIRIAASIHYDSRRDTRSLKTEISSPRLYSDFQPSRDFRKFFRCGQVFSIQITSDLSVEKGRENLVSVVQLPGQITALEAKAKTLRLAQIFALPLVRMVPYSEESPFDQTMVYCRLCTRVAPAIDSEDWMSKDYWASKHFRWYHWRYYYPMTTDRDRLSRKIPGSDSKDSHTPQPSIPTESAGDTFSPESWLKLEGMTSYDAIESDEEIKSLVDGGSQNPWWYCDGPTMIRRFAVIREGAVSCFCLGVHTYAGQGCKNQPDQGLFSVIHSSKVPPTLGNDEANVKLLPIRMRAHHPSTFLPLSARMHFGRVYEIPHNIPAKPLGVIDTDDMELLISQFEKVTRQENISEDLVVHNENIAVPDMTLVEEIRQNIVKVLGPDDHLIAPEEETVAPERKKRRL
ncbi:hypothetical protein DL98DRAFT_534220 [Cadophora sp. DSE1049]|nr:hypothetical protein DL98DRAFT_534220 [Cadophora sp. DSE1049]